MSFFNWDYFATGDPEREGSMKKLKEDVESLESSLANLTTE